MQKTRRSRIFTLAIVLALVFNCVNLMPLKVQAASLANTRDVVSSMKAATLSTHTFTFTTPTGVLAGRTITIAFPVGYTMGATVFGDIDLTDDGVDLPLAAAPAAATWGAAVAGQVLTLTNGTTAVAAGSVMTVEIGANATFGVAGVTRITNPVAGSYTFTIGGTFGDTGSIATAVLADDQISVSGTIAPTLSFAMGTITPDNSIGFGTMSSAAVRYATDNLVGTTTATDTGAYGAATANSVRLTASTNGNGGLSISLKDQGNGTVGGLYNAGVLKNIPAVAPNIVLNPTTAEGYQIFGVQAGQTGGAAFAVSAGFTKTTGTVAVSPTPAVFAACTGPVNAARADVVVASAVMAMTPAGTYVDTLTFTATANF